MPVGIFLCGNAHVIVPVLDDRNLLSLNFLIIIFDNNIYKKLNKRNWCERYTRKNLILEIFYLGCFETILTTLK